MILVQPKKFEQEPPAAADKRCSIGFSPLSRILSCFSTSFAIPSPLCSFPLGSIFVKTTPTSASHAISARIVRHSFLSCTLMVFGPSSCILEISAKGMACRFGFAAATPTREGGKTTVESTSRGAASWLCLPVDPIFRAS